MFGCVLCLSAYGHCWVYSEGTNPVDTDEREAESHLDNVYRIIFRDAYGDKDRERVALMDTQSAYSLLALCVSNGNGGSSLQLL
ncbi:hypothetical protein HPP92_016798 [Vanilla planifolia]|uniref:Uncharacterized protein n=1 Tax=Vanilla planifolia TaxID=51239 RepID=A0A835USF2_VANPL|nr:hypothetical protein HPP92_017428 [Vanilla planifolia]KAG0472252.1 hypothetical protein HPP92_016798 [Vanilla planifolia]